MLYEVREVRSVVYTVEVPDSARLAADDLRAAKLDSMMFWARGCGGIIGESSELVSYSVHPSDDDDPADVVLDEKLRDKYPPDAEDALTRAVKRPHFSERRVEVR